MSSTAPTAPADRLTDAALDRLFRALADPTRRAILARLARGPASIAELAHPFEMSLAAVGQHVKALAAVGLVSCRKVGRSRVCTLDAAAMRDADRWLAQYRRFWTESLDALADYVERGHGDDGA